MPARPEAAPDLGNEGCGITRCCRTRLARTPPSDASANRSGAPTSCTSDVCRALGEPPRPTDVAVELDFGANTHVIGHAGRTFALIEGGFRPYEPADDLETVGPTDFGGTLPGGYTSHPKRDPGTGGLHGVAYSYSGGDTVQYGVIGTDGRGRRMVDIDVTSSRTIHDFSLTDAYVVVYDLPITSSQGWADDNPHRWDPGAPALVGFMPRDGDAADMWWTGIDPCFVFHTLDAFEDGDRIVVDLLRHPDAFSSYLLGSDEGTSTLDRWTIDLAQRAVSEERLDDRPQELPCVDQRRIGRRHRFGYTVGTSRVGENALPARARRRNARHRRRGAPARPGALRVLRQLDRRRLTQSADRIRTTVRARPG